jgi:hypothetical protein
LQRDIEVAMVPVKFYQFLKAILPFFCELSKWNWDDILCGRLGLNEGEIHGLSSMKNMFI